MRGREDLPILGPVRPMPLQERSLWVRHDCHVPAVGGTQPCHPPRSAAGVVGIRLGSLSLVIRISIVSQ